LVVKSWPEIAMETGSRPSMTVTDQSRRIALITGAARRIGRVVALELARAGWSIAIHHRNSHAEAETLATEIRTLGAGAATFEGDLADPTCIETLLPRCLAALSTPSCLINNASVFEFDTLNSLTPAGFAQHMAVNLTAPILLSQAFARALGPRQSGNIINIIDQRVLAPTPEFFSYALSKSALWPATRMLAQALSPNIRVNAIAPGPALRSTYQSAADFAAEAAATILHRGTNPAEIASAVRFILDAPAMTGQMIALDGGQHLRWFPEVTPGAPA
jgi:NAD(P)-dependent dehydrogenase (short-subunit alcohol dehydrogenase family)